VLDIINAAGWQIWPLIFASIIAVAIIFERLWTLRSNIIAPDNLLLEAQKMITKDGVKKEAIQSLQNHSMLGEIFASALNNYNSSSEIIKEAIEETGRAVNHKLERYLSTLATIATVAPLLGLFGTIIGMVELFGSFTSSGHDVAIFARGISIALYNTAGGIVVAVPAMIAYRFFRSKIDNLVIEMEQQAIKLVEVINGKRK
jgi:biopolymer transport protein ExbB